MCNVNEKSITLTKFAVNGPVIYVNDYNLSKTMLLLITSKNSELLIITPKTVSQLRNIQYCMLIIK